ncbi:hypothetical protein BDW59DRAFT_175315 [Aspergillus cavernicola]|uniref:Uncharacterized protein n=1 Tax=Aspergillus cavernicola TaxID=176166 RepID=A0ABR4HQX8_9EURO
MNRLEVFGCDSTVWILYLKENAKAPISRIPDIKMSLTLSEGLWRPGYLQRRILCVFLVIFCISLVALEAVSQLSKSHQGLVTSVESRRYLWTYGPTAIITLIAAFWSRVEFQSKKREPWRTMHETPCTASRSVLLDYVSEAQPLSMLKAIRNKHTAVVASIACSLLLKLLIICSTGLVVHQSLVQPEPSTTVGQAVIIENQILLVIAILILDSREAIMPCNLGTISGMVPILANSSKFYESLCGTGATSLDVLRHCLEDGRYWTHRGLQGFSIEGFQPEQSQAESDHREKYLAWRPFPSLIARILILIGVAAVIAGLEVTLHMSQTHQGLGDVARDGYMHFLWTLLPAVIMVTIALLLASIDFNVRCLAPFAKLKSPGGATLQESLALDFLDTISILNVFQSIRTRQWTVLATTLSTLIASFLSIIASSLYSSIDVPHVTTMNFIQDTVFTADPTKAHSTGGSDAIEVSGLILHNNLTYPPWTYEELTFPKLSIEEATDLLSHSFVDINVPTLRPHLSCHLQTGPNRRDLRTNFKSNPNGVADAPYTSSDHAPYYLDIHAPSEYCPQYPEDANDPITLTLVRPEAYFGIQIPNWGSSSGQRTGSQTLCSNTTYIWGHANTDSIDYIAMLSCNTSAEIVDANTRFHLPDLDIDVETSPPRPDDSSARPVDVHPERPVLDLLSAVSDYTSLDRFFQAVVYGKYSVPMHTLGQSSESNNVIDSIQHNYKIIVAQQSADLIRIPANGTLNNMPFPGTVTNPNRVRIVQDATSTRILEALLGALIVLNVVALVLMNTDHVLPKSPCSIAAVTSLSNVLASYDSGGGGGGEGGRSRFFLGWWDSSGGEKFGIYLSGDTDMIR